MIDLYQFPNGKNFPNMSPFCAKLEAYFVLSKTPYRVVKTMRPDKAPKKKLPYISDNGNIVADSTLIIHYLKDKYQADLDAHLSSEQKSISLAFQRMLENHFFFFLVHSRWVEPNGWQQFGPKVFGKFKWPIRQVVMKITHKRMSKRMNQTGLFTHSKDEQLEMVKKDLEAISVFLGSKTYFFGDKPSSIDSVIFGFVGNAIFDSIDTPISSLAKTFPNLMKHSENILAQFSNR